MRDLAMARAMVAAAKSGSGNGPLEFLVVLMLLFNVAWVAVTLPLTIRAFLRRTVPADALARAGKYVASLANDTPELGNDPTLIADFASRRQLYNQYTVLGFATGMAASLLVNIPLTAAAVWGEAPTTNAAVFFMLATWTVFAFVGMSLASRLARTKLPLHRRETQERGGRAVFLQRGGFFLLLNLAQVLVIILATIVSLLFVVPGERYATIGALSLQDHLWLLCVIPLYVIGLVCAIELLARPTILRIRWFGQDDDPAQIEMEGQVRTQYVQFVRRSVSITFNLVILTQFFLLPDSDGLITFLIVVVAGVLVLTCALVSVVAQVRLGPMSDGLY